MDITDVVLFGGKSSFGKGIIELIEEQKMTKPSYGPLTKEMLEKWIYKNKSKRIPYK